jgi:hypothetical protein
MILGSQARNRPVVDGPDARDHGDRGHSLPPRLQPSEPFDPRQPVPSSVEPDAEVDA